MLNARRFLFGPLLVLAAGALTWTVFATTGTAEPMKGPCKPLTSAVAAVPGCETGSCTFYCSDPCVGVVYTEGNCQATNDTHCEEFTVSVTSKVCRECTCSSSRCRDDGTYNSGTVDRRSCTGAATADDTVVVD